MLDFRDNNSWLFILGFIAIALELLLGVATGFDLVVIGSIFIIAGGIGMISGSFTVALITIIVLSIVYIAVGRKFIKSKLHIATKTTNVDALIGEEAKVFKTITPDKPGQVKINGEIWRAAAEKEIEEGKTVKIHSVSGVTVHVE